MKTIHKRIVFRICSVLNMKNLENPSWTQAGKLYPDSWVVVESKISQVQSDNREIKERQGAVELRTFWLPTSKTQLFRYIVFCHFDDVNVSSVRALNSTYVYMSQSWSFCREFKWYEALSKWATEGFDTLVTHFSFLFSRLK